MSRRRTERQQFVWRSNGPKGGGGIPPCTLKLAVQTECRMCNTLSSQQLHHLFLFVLAERERESDTLIVVYLLLCVISIMYIQNHVLVQFRGAVLLYFFVFSVRCVLCARYAHAHHSDVRVCACV